MDCETLCCTVVEYVENCSKCLPELEQTFLDHYISAI